MAESAYARGIQGHEPVVISGISCRMPESDNMQEFRDNLMNGVDMVTEDDRRWKPGKFESQFIKIISHYKKIGYNINVLEQNA